MNTVQQAWKQFEADVVPKDAGDIQRTEMKRAFYAGAAAIISINAAIGEPGVSEDAALAILDGLQKEVMAFAEKPF